MQIAILILLSTARTQPAKTQTQNPVQTRPEPGTAKQRAIDLLHKNLKNSGLSQSVLDSYQVTDAYEDKRTGHFIVYLQQAYLGIPVYNKIGIYIFKKDTLIDKKLDFISKLSVKAGPKAAFTVNSDQAVRNAARHLSIPIAHTPELIQKDDIRQRYIYKPATLAKQNISSELVWLPINEEKEIRLSWNVRLASSNGNEDWQLRIDAQTGEVLEKNSLIVAEKAEPTIPTSQPQNPSPAPATSAALPAQAASTAPPAVSTVGYRVFPFPLESANFGTRTLDTDPWLKAGTGNNATTLGWHFDNTANYEYTRGNNVWAQEDLAGNNATTGFSDTSSTSIPALTFDRPLNTTVNPTSYSNIRGGIDNLFYWNNLMHDISYQYGFDEAAGNFQADNMGRGGQGNDYVTAFAEDGAGVNNSNFATPPDGENPRMRMYQWNTATTPHLQVNSPAPIALSYIVAESVIGIKNQLAATGPITAGIVLVDDVPSGTSNACSASFTNSSSLVNKIALLNRGGGCNFVTKIKNVQNAGAIAVIVVNNVAGAPIMMSGTDSTITIPAVMVSNTTGDTLKANLTGLTGTLSATGVFIDGSLDNSVIAHEYTHGISNRLTGGPANAGCLANAEQMGEGWSDYVALMVTTDWSTAVVTDGAKHRTIGTYVEAQAPTGPGIRTYPYSTDMAVNPWTYAMLATNTAGEAHTIGEIWCAALWDMTWNLIQMEGIDPDIYHGIKGNNIALQLVLEGMKYQPCSPGFIDARDAILKADSLLYNYKHKCAIWNAFARRGMGKSAQQGSTNSYTDQTAAFDLPAGLGLSQAINKTQLANGDNIIYTIKAYCDCSPLSNISIVDTLSPGLSYTTSSGGVYTAPYVSFSGVSFAANETKTFTIQANVTGSYSTPDTLINDTQDPASYSWTNTITTGGTTFSQSTTRSHTSSHAWYAPDQASNTDFALTSGSLTLDKISTLSFWHYYETDPGYDGGVVEISTDGGSSWLDLAPFMTQNGYNSNLSQTTSGLASRKAFSGSSGGAFIRTAIALTGFAGANAKIRFRFASDNSVGDEGWYIDDILLQNESGTVSIANAFSGATLLSRSNTVSFFGSVPLPINFLSFEAQRQDADALLHWQVNGEINVGKYIVERSADGAAFAAIGEVPQNTSSISTKDYYYTDKQALKGKNYYRIAEEDLDGKRTYSVIRQVNFSSDAAIRLSPVPTYDHKVQLELATGTDAPVPAVLMNALGQTMKMYNLNQGLNLLDLQDFAKGIYFLKIQTSRNDTEIRKIIIQ